MFLIRNSPISRFKTSINSKFISDATNPNFTVDYLTNSCGLSPESSLKASKHIVLESTFNPDKVLSLFESFGLTKSDISTVISAQPNILLVNPDKTLKPKLEFFSKLGFSGPALVKISKTHSSLEKKIIPSVNYLRSLVGSDKEVVAILKQTTWVLNSSESKVGSILVILRNQGVPPPNITKFIMHCSRYLFCKTELLEEKVSEIVKMGFCPESIMFVHGLHAVIGMNKSKWKQTMDLYKSFGWSEGEIISMFKKHPFCMSASVKKISLALDFLMNSMNWSREYIVRYLPVVFLSLENRVVPRCPVLRLLESKNLISNYSEGSALKLTETSFLQRYVSPYEKAVPDLLKIYQMKMGTKSLLLESGNEQKTEKL